jgi:hypothetical protein
MKTLLTILTVFFTVMFSSPSYSKWTKVVEIAGDTHYVDFERIRKHGGYVYYWHLEDLLKPRGGILSFITYIQADCKIFRLKWLMMSFHKESLGRDTGQTPPIPETQKDWKYPVPNSVRESLLKSVCSR